MDDSHLQRVWLLLSSGRVADAEELAAQAESFDPEDSGCWLCLAWCKYRLAKYKDALACAREALRLCPDDDKVLYLIGWIHLALNQDGSARNATKAAIELAPYDSDHHALLATIHASFNRPRKALRASQAALEIDPENLDALHARGDALIQLGHRREGAVLHRNTLAKSPESEQTLVRYGQAQQAVGNHYAAETAYRDALRINAENKDARTLLHRISGAARREYYGGESIEEIGSAIWMLLAAPHYLAVLIGIALGHLGYWIAAWQPFIDGNQPTPHSPIFVLLYGFWWAPTAVWIYVRVLQRLTMAEQMDDAPPWHTDTVLPSVASLLGLSMHLWVMLGATEESCLLATTASLFCLVVAMGSGAGKMYSPRSVMRYMAVFVALPMLGAVLLAAIAVLTEWEFLGLGSMVSKVVFAPITFAPLIMTGAVVWDRLEA